MRRSPAELRVTDGEIEAIHAPLPGEESLARAVHAHLFTGGTWAPAQPMSAAGATATTSRPTSLRTGAGQTWQGEGDRRGGEQGRRARHPVARRGPRRVDHPPTRGVAQRHPDGEA